MDVKKIRSILDPNQVRDLSVQHTVMIEFCGLPNAGKTTVIDVVDRALRRKGFKVWVSPERSNLIRSNRDLGYLYDVRVGIDSLAACMDHIKSKEYDIILYDRAVFDIYCWLEYRKSQQNGVLVDNIIRTQEFFTNFFYLFTACFVLHCKPETTIMRDNCSAISEEDGGISNNKQFLEKLEASYMTGIDKILDIRAKITGSKMWTDIVHLVDTTETTSDQTAKSIFSILENRIKVTAERVYLGDT